MRIQRENLVYLFNTTLSSGDAEDAVGALDANDAEVLRRAADILEADLRKQLENASLVEARAAHKVYGVGEKLRQLASKAENGEEW